MLNRYTQIPKLVDKHPNQRICPERPPHEHRDMQLSSEYIRGLVDGEGCFSFSTTTSTYMGKTFKRKVPAFILQMHARDRCLIEAVIKHLGLKNEIYIYPPYSKDGAKRGWSVRLIVREFGQLKDIIIPFFYKKLKGHKGDQFIEWLEKIGSEPDVSSRFKSLYRLYKWGMYDKLPKFTEKFKD